jgi:thiol-disulfide isomerase/thioredoxin
MSWLSKYRVLLFGILCPFLAFGVFVFFGIYLEVGIPHFPRLSLLTVLGSMITFSCLPFLACLVLAMKNRQKHGLRLSEKIGLAIATLSLVLPARILPNAIRYDLQTHHIILHDVPAPLLSTRDINGQIQSLTAEQGKVVLVNIWGTWCPECRAEMPTLDRLYQQHKQEGLIVFGLSDEDSGTQRTCLQQIPVTYPLLTYNGEVPRFYRQIGSYPVTFVIDRKGHLQPGMTGAESYDKLEAKVVPLLHGSPN